MRKLLMLLVGVVMYNNLFSQAGSFSAVSLDARSVAMGNTYIAGSSGNAIFTNLAANSLNDHKLDFNLSYRPWIEDLSSDYNLGSVSAYYSINTKNSLAIGAKRYKQPTYIITDDNGNINGDYSPCEYLIALGYAYNVSEKTAFSLSMNYLKSDLGEDFNASTIFFDLGYKSSYKKLNYGVVIKNLGSKLKFDDNSSQLPLTFAGGVGYNKTLSINHTLNASLDVAHITIDSNSGISSGVGLEYQYKNKVALRTGYHIMDESIGLNTYSLGLGVKLLGASLDFSWLMADNALKNNYSISCSWSLFKNKESTSIEE